MTAHPDQLTSRLLVCLILFRFLMRFSADENKPIWMHAEEREEQSKVSGQMTFNVLVSRRGGIRMLSLSGYHGDGGIAHVWLKEG